MLRKAPFCMGNFSKNFLNFFSPDGSRIRFPLPGKRRGTASRKRLFCISSILGGFDFPSGETKGELHHGSAFFASLPSSVVSIPPTGETKGSDIRSQAGPFFLTKGALLQNIPPGYFAIHPRKCALRKGDSALCGGRPGLLALGLRCRFGRRLGCVPLAHGALARLSLDAIRVYSECKQQPASTRSQLYLSAA